MISEDDEEAVLSHIKELEKEAKKIKWMLTRLLGYYPYPMQVEEMTCCLKVLILVCLLHCRNIRFKKPIYVSVCAILNSIQYYLFNSVNSRDVSCYWSLFRD